MMKRLIQILKRKHNRNGESMVEVLIASLIIELALIAAVSMIISAGTIILKSKEHYNEFFVRQNTLASGAPASSIESKNISITITPEGTDPAISPTIQASLKTVKADGSTKEVYYYEPSGS